jgi:hypothetical protein
LFPARIVRYRRSSTTAEHKVDFWLPASISSAIYRLAFRERIKKRRRKKEERASGDNYRGNGREVMRRGYRDQRDDGGNYRVRINVANSRSIIDDCSFARDIAIIIRETT